MKSAKQFESTKQFLFTSVDYTLLLLAKLCLPQLVGFSQISSKRDTFHTGIYEEKKKKKKKRRRRKKKKRAFFEYQTLKRFAKDHQIGQAPLEMESNTSW